MQTFERRYDIDWLRVIAIALLLIYHIGISFQPWGVFIGFIQNQEAMVSLWTPMAALNVWRIPILFFVSGMGINFAMRKRSWKELMAERSKRILLPFIVGCIAIVPLHTFIWQHYYQQNLRYTMNPGHLWFLGNLFAYVLILSPLFFYLKKNETAKLTILIKKIIGSPIGLIVIILAMVTEVLVMKPGIYEMYAFTWHGVVLGMVAFLFGHLIILSGSKFWQLAATWRWLFLILAITMFAVRYMQYQLKAPGTLLAIESCFWIFAVLGYVNRYLNRPGKVLNYLKEAAYPVYIVHMMVQYLGCALIFKLEMAAAYKLLLLIPFTLLGSILVYDLLIRRINIMRILFGLNPKEANKLFWKTSAQVE